MPACCGVSKVRPMNKGMPSSSDVEFFFLCFDLVFFSYSARSRSRAVYHKSFAHQVIMKTTSEFARAVTTISFSKLSTYEKTSPSGHHDKFLINKARATMTPLREDYLTNSALGLALCISLVMPTRVPKGYVRSLIRNFIHSRLGITVFVLQATVNTSAESVH